MYGRKHMVTMLFLLYVFCLSLFTGCNNSKQTSSPIPPVELNVSAALGLKDALQEIQQAYETQNPQVKIVYNCAAAGVLQRQIEQGAPADVFISAAHQQIDALQTKGLIKAETRTNLVSNKLVLIVPRNANSQIADFADLNHPSVHQFGMGAPETVPAGAYAKQVFTHLQIWDDIKDKAVLSKDILAVVHNVETGNVDAGIAFSTVAITSNKVKIVAEAQPGSHENIVFPGAVLSTSRHPREAEDFLAYLTSPPAVSIFEKYGFSIPK